MFEEWHEQSCARRKAQVFPEEKFGLACFLPSSTGLVWGADLPSRPGRGSIQARTRPPRDPSVSHPETLERGGENRWWGPWSPFTLFTGFLRLLFKHPTYPLESTSPRRPGGPGHVISPTLMS